MLGIMVSSAALIIVLSVFNGMETLIGGWFNAFNPDFKISLAEGKSFVVDSFPKDRLAQLPGVEAVEEVVSDMVLTTYRQRQSLLYLKGVESQYPKRNHYQDILVDGEFDLDSGAFPNAVIGTLAAGKLQISLDRYDPLRVYYPKRKQRNLADPTRAFATLDLYPAGIFNTNTNHDEQYVFCPIAFARELMQYRNEATSVEVKLKNSENYKKYQSEIQDIVGPHYRVQNKYEQEESLFRTMQSEKLVIYVILTFILLVAAFNIIGSLGMLILEKRNDTVILGCMGADRSLLRRIFIYEGMSISFVGGVAGMIFGAVICLLQQTFHIVKLGGDGAGYIIPYYPVQMRFIDFVTVLVTVIAVSLFTSLIPTHNIKKLSA